jgi:hypothetical protein
MGVKKAIFFVLLFCSFNASAKQTMDTATSIIDVVLFRPVGLITTVAGAGLFVVISPFTALASISHPHDAFKKAANLLVIPPGKFTFDRPFGVLTPDADGEYRS